MASEEKEGKEDGAPLTVVEACIEWATRTNLESQFDTFARENAHIFSDSAESKEEDPVHKLEYTECHENFLALFEEHLEGFLSTVDSTPAAFFEECKGVMADEYCALFEDHHNKWFVDMLLGMMEYKHFYGLMVNEARRRTMK